MFGVRIRTATAVVSLGAVLAAGVSVAGWASLEALSARGPHPLLVAPAGVPVVGFETVELPGTSGAGAGVPGGLPRQVAATPSTEDPSGSAPAPGIGLDAAAASSSDAARGDMARRSTQAGEPSGERPAAPGARSRQEAAADVLAAGPAHADVGDPAELARSAGAAPKLSAAGSASSPPGPPTEGAPAPAGVVGQPRVATAATPGHVLLDEPFAEAEDVDPGEGQKAAVGTALPGQALPTPAAADEPLSDEPGDPVVEVPVGSPAPSQLPAAPTMPVEDDAPEDGRVPEPVADSVGDGAPDAGADDGDGPPGLDGPSAPGGDAGPAEPEGPQGSEERHEPVGPTAPHVAGPPEEPARAEEPVEGDQPVPPDEAGEAEPVVPPAPDAAEPHAEPAGGEPELPGIQELAQEQGDGEQQQDRPAGEASVAGVVSTAPGTTGTSVSRSRR